MSRFTADGLIDALYNRARAKNTLAGIPAPALAQEIAKRRKLLWNTLGLPRLTAVEQPLRVTPVDRQRREGYTLECYEMAFLPDFITPLYLLRPDQPALGQQGGQQAVVYLNGHGGSCMRALLPQDEGEYHKRFPLELVQQGYLVLVPELAGFGEVIKQDYKERELAGCYALTTQLQLMGISMGGLRCLQAMRGLDWLMAGNTVEKVAVSGISGGGLVSMLMCALDQRLDAGVVFCYANTFYHSVMAMRHCVDNYMPAILADVGEIADILALAAPMPMLISGGEKDDIFPVGATRQAFADVQAVYGAMKAYNSVELEIFKGGHELSTAQVFNFLQRALQ